jgi:hypothetical protein
VSRLCPAAIPFFDDKPLGLKGGINIGFASSGNRERSLGIFKYAHRLRLQARPMDLSAAGHHTNLQKK